MTFHTDVENAIFPGLGNAQQDVAVLRLPLVKGRGVGLTDLSRYQLGGTGNTAAIPAGNWQIVSCGLKNIDNLVLITDLERGVIPVPQGDVERGF